MPDLHDVPDRNPSSARLPGSPTSRETTLVSHDFELGGALPTEPTASAPEPQFLEQPNPIIAPPGEPPVRAVIIRSRRQRGLVALLLLLLVGSWSAIFYLYERSQSDRAPTIVRQVVAPTAESPSPDSNRQSSGPVKLEVEPLRRSNPARDLAGMAASIAAAGLPVASESPLASGVNALTGRSEASAGPPPPPTAPTSPPTGIGFDPPSEASLADANDGSDQDTRLALDDIQKASAAKRLERQTLEDARNNAARLRAIQVEQARRQSAPAIAARSVEVRQLFHRELRQVLSSPSRDQAAAVLRLAARYNAEPAPALERRIARDPRMRGLLSTQHRGRRIQVLRSYGVSEPAILGDLIVLELRQPKGPRSQSLSRDQAILRAARQLLAAPAPSLNVITAQHAIGNSATARTKRIPSSSSR